MYEYIRTKQTSASKPCTSHSVMQQRAKLARNRYADRNTKMGYYPRRETGSVIQRMWGPRGEICKNCKKSTYSCQCGKFTPGENWQDRTFHGSHQSEPYLNSTALRANLGAPKHDGEAHHILPGNVVKEKGWATDKNKNIFNQRWNGIILNGSFADGLYQCPRQDPSISIFHRKNGRYGHPVYDDRVGKYTDNMKMNTLDDCKNAANDIRDKIINSRAYSLDDMTF